MTPYKLKTVNPPSNSTIQPTEKIIIIIKIKTINPLPYIYKNINNKMKIYMIVTIVYKNYKYKII